MTTEQDALDLSDIEELEPKLALSGGGETVLPLDCNT